jgi:hypothetical protein
MVLLLSLDAEKITGKGEEGRVKAGYRSIRKGEGVTLLLSLFPLL